MGALATGIFNVIYKLFIVAVIVFLAYVVTRFMGIKYTKNFRGKNITVIESVSIGLDRMLYIVKIGMQYFLIAASGKSISFLSELNPTNINLDNLEQSDNSKLFDADSFSKYLEFFNSKKQVQNNKQQKSSSLDSQDYDISSIEKNIDKIKGISKNIKTPYDGVE